MDEMTHTSLAHWLDAQPSGRPLLTSALRAANGDALKELLPGLELPDESFEDPRLFAWTGGTRPASMTLAQLLPIPIPNDGILTALPVCADDTGSAYLSARGYWLQARPNTALEFRPGAKPTLCIEGIEQPGHWLAPRLLAGTRIEWIQRMDPVIFEFLRRYVAGGDELEMEFGDTPFARDAGVAVAALHSASPVWHRLLLRAVKSVLLFRHSDVASFATLGMHGLVAVNVSRGDTAAAFLDMLVHQGGHVAFTEATLDRRLWFAVPPDSLLSGHVGAVGGTRSVYEATHGLFTAAAVLEVTSQVNTDSLPSAEDQLELRGRAALALSRLSRDLEVIHAHAAKIFSVAGHKLFDVLVGVSHKHPGAQLDIQRLDLGGHGEDFDTHVFRRSNPLSLN